MKFSILQSVYQKDNPIFLAESLKSLSESTVKPVQVILVKDGLLTDELESVITEWQKKLPLKVVGYEKNQGLAHALNFGLQFVEAELVARMDSDDICYPDRFEKQLAFFEKNSHIEIVGAGISEFYVQENGNIFRRNRLYPQIVTKSSKSLFKGTPLGHPTIMMKTSLLKEFLYSESTTMCEDIELWFRLIRNDHIIHNLQEPLLNFRITDGTFKRRSLSKAFSEFKIYFSNLFSLFGLNILLLYPIARLFVRFLPYRLNKKLYFSNARKSLFGEKAKILRGDESIV